MIAVWDVCKFIYLLHHLDTRQYKVLNRGMEMNLKWGVMNIKTAFRGN